MSRYYWAVIVAVFALGLTLPHPLRAEGTIGKKDPTNGNPCVDPKMPCDHSNPGSGEGGGKGTLIGYCADCGHHKDYVGPVCLSTLKGVPPEACFILEYELPFIGSTASCVRVAGIRSEKCEGIS